MKLLTHNVYWFQGYPPRWGAERVAEVPEVLESLTRLYAAEAPDLLCLQETHHADLVRTLAARLEMAAWLHAPGGLRADYGGAILARRTAPLRDLTHPAGHPPHDRVHLRASLDSDAGPLEVAAIHLPSNRYAADAEAGRNARLAELTRILDTAPRPHIVCGDLNSKPGSPACRLLEERGYSDAAVVTGLALDPHRIDYIWMDKATRDRLIRFACLDGPPFQRTGSDGRGWMLSDHPPLVAEWR